MARGNYHKYRIYSPTSTSIVASQSARWLLWWGWRNWTARWGVCSYSQCWSKKFWQWLRQWWQWARLSFCFCKYPSGSDNFASQNTFGHLTARSETVWKNITGVPGVGRVCAANVLSERPGPTSYCHRSIVHGSHYSAFHLFIDKEMFRSVQKYQPRKEGWWHFWLIPRWAWKVL